MRYTHILPSVISYSSPHSRFAFSTLPATLSDLRFSTPWLTMQLACQPPSSCSMTLGPGLLWLCFDLNRSWCWSQWGVFVIISDASKLQGLFIDSACRFGGSLISKVGTGKLSGLGPENCQLGCGKWEPPTTCLC